MKSDEQEIELLLARVRRRLSPLAADEERVLAATLAHLAAPLPSGGSPPDVMETGRWTLASPALRRVLSALGIAAISAGAGYYAGLRDGSVRATAPLSSVTPAGEASAAPKNVRVPLRVADPAPPSPPNFRQEPAANGRSRPAAASGSHAKPSSFAGAAPGVAAMSYEDGVEEELRLLRRVQRAERQGNPRLALALLAELDQSVPSGKLGEERAAARVMARCALGEGSSAALLVEFAKRYPESVYTARVTQACTLAERETP